MRGEQRRLNADIGPRFRAAAPRLADACAAIASLGLGPTVVHGDFHPWNVLRDGDRVVVVDWSDAALGHPFTDLATWLNRLDDVAVRRSMVNAWLDCWADAAPLEPGSDGVFSGAGQAFARWALAWLDDGLAASVPRRA